MGIVTYTQEAPDGDIKCMYIDFLRFRVLIAVSKVNWYTKGVNRKIPIWVSDKGIFIYRLAVRFGRRVK